MCLAVPAQIIEVHPDGMGVADHAGNRREISLMLLDNPTVGDYVIIHAGFAIHTVDEESARQSIELLKTLAMELPRDYDPNRET